MFSKTKLVLLTGLIGKTPNCLTSEKTAAASFCDSPYHLSVKDDT